MRVEKVPVEIEYAQKRLEMLLNIVSCQNGLLYKLVKELDNEKANSLLDDFNNNLLSLLEQVAQSNQRVYSSPDDPAMYSKAFADFANPLLTDEVLPERNLDENSRPLYCPLFSDFSEDDHCRRCGGYCKYP